ncbi:hypothetical protein JCM33374_g5297 [Metschnikowia sp. JCM 33374]|nr:hypothetical protein JCM33374_g5297 [Metschnikowia sp. JCM 33374]
MDAAAKAGADVVDAASNAMSGMTSQPSISALMASFECDVNHGLDENLGRELDNYWAQMRLLYSCFEADLKGPDPEVYQHEIPGGQLTNLIFQAQQLGLGEKWLLTKEKLKEDVLKLAPELDFPDSVLDFMEGLMGTPYGGFPEPLRTNMLGNKRAELDKRPGLTLKPVDFAQIREELASRYIVEQAKSTRSRYGLRPKRNFTMRHFNPLEKHSSTCSGWWQGSLNR